MVAEVTVDRKLENGRVILGTFKVITDMNPKIEAKLHEELMNMKRLTPIDISLEEIRRKTMRL